MEPPKRLERILKRLAAEGEEAVIICPALLLRYASGRMLAIARMGMLDKAFSYLIVTKKNVHFVRPGMLWDKVETVPLEKISGVEYAQEFLHNTIHLKVDEATENIIFYDESDGINFYRYVKSEQWKS
jgi:hypothetical protein